MAFNNKVIHTIYSNGPLFSQYEHALKIDVGVFTKTKLMGWSAKDYGEDVSIQAVDNDGIAVMTSLLSYD